MRVIHIENVGTYFVGIDLSKAVSYNDDDNARRVVRTLVLGKYRMRLGDVQNILWKEVDVDLSKEDTVLFKELGLYWFLFRWKKPKPELFIEWVVETVLPRVVRKLTSAIEEKDSALTLLTDDLQDRDNQIKAIQYENVALQAERDVYQAQLQRRQDTITHLRTRYVPYARNPGKDTLSSLYGNIQHLRKKNIMTCHIMLRGYNDVKGMLN